MNKQNNKYLYLIISIFLININLFTSYAQSTESILTFDEALEISLRNSIELRKLSNQGRKANEKGELLSYDLDFYNPNYDTFSQEFAYFVSQAKTIDFEKELVVRNEIITRENIKLQLITSFNNIDKINNELNLLNEKIFREQEKQRLESIKKNLGVTSEFDIKTGENKFNSLLKSKDEKEQELKQNYFDLAKILNTSVDMDTKIQPITFEYEPLNQEKREIDFNSNRAVQNNIIVWSKEKEIDFKKLELDLFAVSITPFSTGASIGSESYSIKEIDKSMLSNDLRELQSNAKNSVVDKYNSIKKIEVTISNLYQQKISIYDEIEMMKIRESFGLITNEPIKDMKLQLKELENTIYELKKQHEYLKNIYENPFLASM